MTYVHVCKHVRPSTSNDIAHIVSRMMPCKRERRMAHTHSRAHEDLCTVEPGTGMRTMQWYRGRFQSCVASVIRMALCVLKLMPILDLVTDFATFQTYMMQGWYELALVIFGIILATWRFLTVYSALTPKPTPGNIAIIYMPGALHLFWERLTFDGDEDEMAKRAWKQEPAKAVEPITKLLAMGNGTESTLKPASVPTDLPRPATETMEALRARISELEQQAAAAHANRRARPTGTQWPKCAWLRVAAASIVSSHPSRGAEVWSPLSLPVPDRYRCRHRYWGVMRGGSSRRCPPPPRSDLTWTRQRVTLYPLPPRSDLTWASDPLRAALADLKLGGGYPLPQPRSDLTWAGQRVRRAEGRRRTGSTVAPDPRLASRVYLEVAEHFPGAIRSVERVVMPAAVLRSSCAGE